MALPSGEGGMKTKHMTEPIYEYVKGEGWVIINNTVTMKCGTVVSYEIRNPKANEDYKRLLRSDYCEGDIPRVLAETTFERLSIARQGPQHYVRMSVRYLLVVIHTVSKPPQ